MRVKISIMFIVCLLAFACKRSEIPVYQMEDSAVCFYQVTNSFSLRGMTEPQRTISVPITLIGRVAPYARPISYRIEEVSAKEGTDFTVVSAEVPAGALKGSLVLNVNKLSEDEDSKEINVTLLPNDDLKEGYGAYLTARVAWTASYERPKEQVWRYWWLYISRSYSKNYHKILVDIFGDDIEIYTCSKKYVEEDPSLVYKITTWWMSANHDVIEYVRAHDLANPGNPYRHSSDYESFKGYAVGVGMGEGLAPGQTPPTILETLNNL